MFFNTVGLHLQKLSKGVMTFGQIQYSPKESL